MASARFLREKRLLTLAIYRVDARYAKLRIPGSVLQLRVTNLRNRPLSGDSVNSMKSSILSLYHNLVTGCKTFPVIPSTGCLTSLKLDNPFDETHENARPSRLTEAPAGVMVPRGSSSSRPPTMLTPPLPEKADLGALKADRRNCVRTMPFIDSTVTRVISTVYRSEDTELTNRWRVTDYTAKGNVVMSVLCQFTEKSAEFAKRKAPEDESSSSPSPPKKRLRV